MEFATRFDGLQKHPKFSELINYIQDDPEVVNYPNRWASWANESPFLSQFKDDWLDETYTSHMTHLQWKMDKGGQDVYDHATQDRADYGLHGPSSIGIGAAQDIAGAALAATTVVRISEPPVEAQLPGVEVPDALGLGVAKAMGRRRFNGRGLPRMRPAEEEEEEEEPYGKVVSAALAVGDVIDAAGAVVTGTVAAGLRAGKSLVKGALPALAGAGRLAMSGAAALDQALFDMSSTAMQSVQDSIVAEGRRALTDIMSNGPSGERAPLTGLMLPYSVLNGENPGIGRLALGSSSSLQRIMPLPAAGGLVPAAPLPAPALLALQDGPVRSAPSTERMTTPPGSRSSGRASSSSMPSRPSPPGPASGSGRASGSSMPSSGPSRGRTSGRASGKASYFAPVGRGGYPTISKGLE